jgi:hypothetical protein
MRRTQQRPPVPQFRVVDRTPPATVDPTALHGWPAPTDLASSTLRQAGASRAAAAGLWALLATAVALGAVNFLAAPPAAPQRHAGTAAGGPTDTAPPGGCAELLVAAWLAGDAGALAGLAAVQAPRLPAGRRTASRTYTVAAAPTGPVWTYTIAVDVVAVDTAGGAARPTGTQFFAVSLARDPAGGGCGGWSALTLPAQVAGPAAVSGLDPAYSRTLPTSSTPLADTLTRFFGALLCGAGELDRYTAPTAAVRAVTPPPYTAARLERVVTAAPAEVLGAGDAVPADGTAAKVLVTVAGKAGEAGEWPLTYHLAVVVRGGRWEVAAIEPAPTPPASTGHTSGPATAPPRSSTPSPSATRP